MEGTNKVGEGVPTPNPLAQEAAKLPDDQLTATLEDALSKPLPEQTGEPAPVADPAKPPEQVAPQSPAVPAEQATVKKEEPTQPGQVKAKVEPKPEVKPEDALKIVEKQTGKKTPEEIAKLYLDLRKGFHQQRQQEAKATQVAPTVQAEPAAPVQPYDDLNTKVRESMDVDPIGTMAKVFNLMNQGNVENDKQRDLHSKIRDLSTSPETADFNSDEVQGNIKKLLENDYPELIPNVEKYLPLLYKAARGDLLSQTEQAALQRGQALGAQDQLNKAHARVETSSPSVREEPKILSEASDDELKAALLEKLK